MKAFRVGLVLSAALMAGSSVGQTPTPPSVERVRELDGNESVALPPRAPDRLTHVTAIVQTPPRFLTASILGPGAFLNIALLGLSALVFTWSQRRKREAERLREQMLQQERAGRLALQQENAERKRAEQLAQTAKDEADAASRAKSQFLASMSHELRTPLNAIIGYSEMLAEEAVDLGDEAYLPDLEKIRAAGKHLLGLINDILDLSKIEAGKMTLFLETFEIEKLVQEVAATVQPLVKKNQNRLHLHCSPDLGSMKADVTKVRQALFNLLANASKFTERGDIWLSASRQDDKVLLEVRDTGIGMDPEQLRRLFQPFTQADASTSRKYGGTGLGLTLSRNFCQLMGGDLRAASQAGAGSTFTVVLPAEVTEAVKSPAPASPRVDLVAGDGWMVLVIDDDPNTRDLMQRALVKEGYRIAVADSGRVGLELAVTLKPSVILLDVLMPGMDGWAVLAALKANPLVADIPVVMMTILDDKNLAFSLGAADYLAKPVDWERLNALLAKYHLDTNAPEILVVDDDPQARDLLRRCLEKNQCRVLEAENGRVAQTVLTRAHPQLVLLDLIMPEMDGFEFLRQARPILEAHHIPVIVITSKDLTEEERRTLNGCVAQVLQKGGYRLADLLAHVRVLLKAK